MGSRQRAGFDAWVDTDRVRLDSVDASAGETSRAAEDHLVVRAGVRGLPPRQRAVVVLRYRCQSAPPRCQQQVRGAYDRRIPQEGCRVHRVSGRVSREVAGRGKCWLA